MIPDLSQGERMFIGCLLRSPHEFWQVNETVTVDCLNVPHHQAIYDKIRELSERGRPVSISALQAVLPEEFDDAGPTAGILWSLRESAAEAGSATDYASALAERLARKRLDQLAAWIGRQTVKLERNAEEVAAEAALKLQTIMSSAMTTRPVAIGDVAATVVKQANSAHADEFTPGISTGIGPLDTILGLILPGDLGFILASQADGKSALAAQIGMHAAKEGRAVLFVQMEMSQEQMGARELARLSQLSVGDINEGAFDAFQWDSLVAAQKSLGAVPFHILDVEEITVRQIKSQATAMKARGGLSLVIVDQLDKIKPEGKYRDRFEAYKEVTRDLKRMTKSLVIPGICLAQRTRQAQRRDDPTPHILDADIPSIERDADFVIGLWQRANWLQGNRPDPRGGDEALSKWQAEILKCKGLAEAITLKHRRRKAYQTCKMQFEGRTMQFSERKV